MDLMIALRPVTADDEPFLFELFRALRAGRYDDHPGGHPQMKVMIRLQFQAQEHTLASRHPGSKHSIILLNGIPVGRMRVARDETGIDLADLSILPSHQRKGIGRAVMKDLIAEADRDALPIRTAIMPANKAALNFCRDFGFEVTERNAAHVELQRIHLQPHMKEIEK